MKKLKDLAILSAGALLTVSLAACGNTNHSDDKNSSKVSTSKVAKSSSKKKKLVLVHHQSVLVQVVQFHLALILSIHQ